MNSSFVLHVGKESRVEQRVSVSALIQGAKRTCGGKGNHEQHDGHPDEGLRLNHTRKLHVSDRLGGVTISVNRRDR